MQVSDLDQLDYYAYPLTKTLHLELASKCN